MNLETAFDLGIQTLAQGGLNVFASGRVRTLPSEIRGQIEMAGFEGDSLCLVGNGGRALWPRLPKPLLQVDPVDTYTMEMVRRFAAESLQDRFPEILYPHKEFVLPLQRLGRFFNLAHPSLFGLDLHREFGPWFAYRCAFLTRAKIPEHKPAPFPPPCESCEYKPCRSACPPSAVGQSASAFKLSTCADFRLQAKSPCLDRCLARLACPYQEQHRYTEEQIRYHMLRPGHLRRLGEYGSR